MSGSNWIRVVLIVALVQAIAFSAQYSLESGKIYFQVKQTPNSSPELFQFNYDSSIKSELKLTQSSKIDIQAKLKFNSAQFQPELISFRLKHDTYDKLTEPVQALYDDQSESFKCVVDLGDPNTVQPYSDLYMLELIIADEFLAANVRNTVAKIRINFRYSMSQDQVPHKNTAISYKTPNLIETRAPEERIDPPQTFTSFLLVVMGAVSSIFYYSIFMHLKANFKNIPTSDVMGMVLNLGLIMLLVINLVFLGKFWLEWNFITMVGNMFWLLVITAFVANYALLYMKKKSTTTVKNE